MKRLLLMVVAFFTATSVAIANPTSKMDMLSMSKADSSFLFNGKANVIALNKTELKQTNGEFCPVFWALIIYTVQYANAPSYGDRVYNGYPYARGRWRWLNW